MSKVNDPIRPGEWVSVKEKLPHAFVPVIVAGGVGLWTGSKWNTITACEWPGQTIAWEVTHWMPIPHVTLYSKTINEEGK